MPSKALLHTDLCPASLAQRGKMGFHPEGLDLLWVNPAGPGSSLCPGLF